MSDAPWLTIVGLGEDGPDGLAPTSQAALAAADVIMGPPRHLSLLPEGLDGRRIEWPVPFADGLNILKDLRGQSVAVLASGDPFWFGAGSLIAKVFDASEWTALPGHSTFSLAAARLGWPLEKTACIGLHAAPLHMLRPHLAPGNRLIVLLRDGAAVNDLATYLVEAGFAESTMTICEALGGPRERLVKASAAEPGGPYGHPVCAAVEVAGSGLVLPATTGIADDFFETDGQITKRPMRALTLSALAPRPGEVLWDIGGGSGSIAIEWLLSDPTTEAFCIEAKADRAERILRNATALGQDRLTVITGTAPAALDGLPAPDAVFIGGGLCDDLLEVIEARAPMARIVANGVTLEAEALLCRWQARRGGSLLRVELSHAQPLGKKTAWKAQYPVVQWSFAP